MDVTAQEFTYLHQNRKLRKNRKMFQKEVCFWPYRKTSAAIFQVVSDTKYAIFETMKSEQAFLTYFVPLFLDNASLHNISKKSVSTSVSLPKKIDGCTPFHMQPWTNRSCFYLVTPQHLMVESNWHKNVVQQFAKVQPQKGFQWKWLHFCSNLLWPPNPYQHFPFEPILL